MNNGSGKIPLNSPRDSTLQYGAGEIYCALASVRSCVGNLATHQLFSTQS